MGVLELQATSMAVGGEAVARDDGGRVVFVAGALPGERVLVDVVDERRSFARGVVLEVLDASAGRVVPPCPHVGDGCGGCDWQHVAEDAQRRLRRDLVADVLARAGVGSAPVELGPAVPAARVRTTVRGIVTPDGRFGFRQRRSHDPVEVASCLVAHPLVDEVIAGSTFAPSPDGRAEVTIRVGARTGDRMVVAAPNRRGARVPEGVPVVGADELRRGRRAWIHEEAAGRRWRVSADSFFQASPEGADALVRTVGAWVDELLPDAERLVDLCCGVGLFAGTVGAGRHVVGVERSAAAVADARVNLAEGAADHGPASFRAIKVALGRWRPDPADVVVADPARSGLGKEGVAAVAGTGAPLCVLVSCDPAALGRDAGLLGEAGYRLVGATVLDLFGHTSHVEVVSAFRRDPVLSSGRVG